MEKGSVFNQKRKNIDIDEKGLTCTMNDHLAMKRGESLIEEKQLGLWMKQDFIV